MFNFSQLSLSRAVLYTSLIALSQSTTVNAMDTLADFQKKNQVTTRKVNGKTITEIDGVSRETFHRLMKTVLEEQGFQIATAQASSETQPSPDDSVVLDLDTNPFFQNSQKVMDILTSLYPQQIQGSRLTQAKARQFNQKLQKDGNEATRKFNQIIQQKGISPQTIQKLSNLTYGLQKLQTDYYIQMKDLIIKEKHIIKGNKENKLLMNGYAVDFIDPQDVNARARFLKDAFAIFMCGEETSQVFENELLKAQPTFYSFVKIYLGLVRDLNGGLFAREQALNLTSLQDPEDINLGDAEMKARRNVFSLHYLGTIERTFQVLDLLHPLAEVAYEVADSRFNREMIAGCMDLSRREVNRLFLQEHGITMPEDFIGPLPTEVSEKPLSKTKMKKLKQQAKALEQLQQQRALLEEDSSNPAPVVKATPKPVKQAVKSSMDISEIEAWFNRTERGTGNLKKDYRTPTEEQIHKDKKAEAKTKKEKQKPSLSIVTDDKEVQPAQEKKVEDKPQECVFTTLHDPHKNGSKKFTVAHREEVKELLTEGGYTLEACQDRKELNLGGGPWKVFLAIHNGTFTGEAHEVCNLIRQLEGHADETRSGSRIGLMLRHITTRKFVGTDLMLGGVSGETTKTPSIETATLN